MYYILCSQKKLGLKRQGFSNVFRPPHLWIHSTCRKHFPVLSAFMNYHPICNQSNTTGATRGAGTAFTPGFSRVRVSRSLAFCVLFCRSLFVLLYFFLWPLCCLSFFDLRIIITLLTSSSPSYTESMHDKGQIKRGKVLVIGYQYHFLMTMIKRFERYRRQLVLF